MTDIKDLIIAKQEELIENLTIQLITPEPTTAEAEYKRVELICSEDKLRTELVSLKATIDKVETVDPNNFECSCGRYSECICEMKKHWKTGESEYVKSLASDTEAGKDELERGIRIACIGADNKDYSALLAAKGILPKDKVIIITGDNKFTGTSYPELKPSDPFPVKMPIVIVPEILRFEAKDGQSSRRERRAKERKESKQ